jgi:hypothetical protein
VTPKKKRTKGVIRKRKKGVTPKKKKKKGVIPKKKKTTTKQRKAIDETYLSRDELAAHPPLDESHVSHEQHGGR